MSKVDKPKYQMLKEYISDLIVNNILGTGEKIPSENELADRFEISRHTVRQAIGEMTNEGWLYRVQGKGTYVNQNPDAAKQKPGTIAVMTTYLSDYIFPSIIRGIDSVLSENGYNIVLGCTNNQHGKENQILENFLSQNIAGLIVEPTKSALPNPNTDLYKKIHENNIPILFMHGYYRELDYSYIIENDEMAGYIAAKHLIDLGHKKIGGIFKIDDIQGHLRFAGYQRALKENNIVASDSCVVWYDTDDITRKIDEQYLKGMLKQCSALICYNDEIAVKVMDLMRKVKIRIPEDMSLVGFDDSQLAVASETKLTSIAHPKEVLGIEAAKAMIQMICNKEKHENIVMQAELIIRNSTKSYEGGK
jgi:GntR family transcriptional regulator of arabinose operon